MVMRFQWLIIVFVFCFAPAVIAQTTTVTGTVTDINGLPYGGATLKAQLVLAGGGATGQATVTNTNQAQCSSGGFGNAPCQMPFPGTAGPWTLDSGGKIPGGGINLQDNTLVTPAATKWLFTVNTSGSPPPLGTGPQTCSATLTITGASQSLSANFAACPALDASLANPNITGSLAVSGPATFTGAFKTTNFGAEIYPSGLAGVTCGDKIASAIALLPAGGGVLNINNACGLGTQTAPWATVTVANANVVLRFVEPGIYFINSVSFTSAAPNSGITSQFPCVQGIGNQQNCPVSLKVGNGVNPAAAISLAGTQNFVEHVILDGNKANNPTGGVGIFVNKANRVIISDGTTQNFSSHGIFVSSTLAGDESGQGILRDWSSTLNNGDGVFALNSADWILRVPILENNGKATPPTVNTTSTTITATAGSWSTDSSLVGTMVRVNNTGMCQVVAIPSTTTITVAAATCWNASGVPTALGVQTGVNLNWGNGWEGSNSPTVRISGSGELSANGMDGFLTFCTSTGLGSNGNNVTAGMHLAQNLNHDIEVIGSALDTQATQCAMGNSFVGNTHWNGTLRTVANTFDKIKLVDGGLNTISGNYFNPGPTILEKAAYEQVESTSGRLANGNQNRISGNTFNGAFGTALYVDSTLNGSVGFQVPTFPGGVAAALDIFDISTGAATPHKYIRTVGGSLQIVNNAGTTVIQMLDGGQLQLLGAGQGILATEGAPGAGATGSDYIFADSTAHRWKMNNNNGGATAIVGDTDTQTLTNKSTSAGPLVGTVASGTATMTTAAIAAGACGTTVTVAAAGVLTTDTITVAFNAAPAGSNAGLVAWPTAGNVNFSYCPGVAETPAAATVNWRVPR